MTNEEKPWYDGATVCLGQRWVPDKGLINRLLRRGTWVRRTPEEVERILKGEGWEWYGGKTND